MISSQIRVQALRKTQANLLLFFSLFLSIAWFAQQLMPETFSSPVARIISFGAIVFSWVVFLSRKNLSEATTAVSILICGAAFGLQGALNFGSPVYVGFVVLALIPLTSHMIDRGVQILLFGLYLGLIVLVAEVLGFERSQTAVHVMLMGLLTFGASRFVGGKDQLMVDAIEQLDRLNQLNNSAVDLDGLDVFEVNVDTLDGNFLKGEFVSALGSDSLLAKLRSCVLDADQAQELVRAIRNDDLDNLNRFAGASYIAEFEYFTDESRKQTRWNRISMGKIYERGDKRYRLILRRDITTLKQREIKLRELNLSLDQLRRSQRMALDITQSAVMEINVKTGVGKIIEGSALLLPIGEPFNARKTTQSIVDQRDHLKILSLLERRNASEVGRIINPETGELRYWARFSIGDEFERDGERFVLFVRQIITGEVELTQQIKTQNEQFQLASRAAKVAIFRQDLSDNSVTLNDWGYELFGITRQAVTSLTFDTFIKFAPADEMDDIREKTKLAIKTGKPQSMTHTIFNASGELLHVNVRFAAQFEEGRAIAILGAITDITQQFNSEAQARALIVQLEQTRIDLETAIVGGQIGLFTRESGQEHIEVNSVFREITGLSDAQYPEITKTQWRACIHPDDLEKQVKAFDTVKDNGEFQRYELRITLPCKGLRNILFSLSKDTHDPAHPTYRGSIIDVTEMRSTESRLRAELAKQEQLFAIIGHELRTPASALQMLLEDQHVTELEPHGQTISDTLNHLMSVLDDMRVVTNPEMVLDFKPVAAWVPDIVQRSLPLVARLTEEKKLRISLEQDDLSNTQCVVREQLLRQITLNLVKNCALHAKASQLNIRITAEDKDPYILFTLRFEDNGKGISAKNREQLFKPFERGDTQEDGSGLGLHIAQTYARTVLQGDLSFEPADPTGAAFVLTARFLKATAELEEPQQPHPEVAQTNDTILSGRRILYAEDSPVLRMMTAKALELKGARLTLAEDGVQAIEQAFDQPFDLVLTDIFMPNADGYQLTSYLREQGYTGPILGLTAAVVGDESDRLIEFGANEVLPKPLNMQALLAAVARHSDLMDQTADQNGRTGLPRVMVIDDDPITLGRLESILEDQFEVSTVSSGIKALERFKELRPDLVLCDVQMPDLDGFAVLKSLHELSPELPVIMTSSASSMDHYFKIAQAMGANSTVDKLSNAETLIETLSSAIKP